MLRPIFITGRFRSGTTAIWNLFKKAGEFACFYEPLHQGLERSIEFVDPMSSHRGVDTYWDAYRTFDIYADAMQWKLGVTRLYLEEGDDFHSLYRHINGICNSSDQLTPVLKFNRIDLRLKWIAKNFPDAVIVNVRRNARQSWLSSRLHLLGDCLEGRFDDPLDMDAFDLGQWIVSLRSQFPFLAEFTGMPSYAAWYAMSRLSDIVADSHAHIVLQLEEVSADPQAALSPLAKYGLMTDEAMRSSVEVIESISYRDPSIYHSHE